MQSWKKVKLEKMLTPSERSHYAPVSFELLETKELSETI